MQKITITDFSGGINERVLPEDFASNQWARLTGFMPDSNGQMKTQPSMVQIGEPDFIINRIHVLESSSGTYLVVITEDGEIAWTKDNNAVTSSGTPGTLQCEWTIITEKSNYDGDLTIPEDSTFQFICNVPLQGYKYLTDGAYPPAGDPLDYSLQTLSAVLIGSTNNTGNMVAFVNDNDSVVEVIAFPWLGRVPYHEESVSNIKIRLADGSYYDWVASYEDGGFTQPYTYLDINSTLLPGRGLIPRANAGVVKNNLLLLGDIVWRSDLSNKLPDTTNDSPYLLTTSGGNEIDTEEYELAWPSAPFPQVARVLFNSGPGVVYLKDNNAITSHIVGYTVGSSTLTFETLDEHSYAADDTVEISNLEGPVNGIYKVLSSPAPTTNAFTVSRTFTGRQLVKRSSTGTTRTLETSTAHNLVSGQWITVSAINASYDGSFKITSIPSPKTFTYTAVGSVTETNVTSTGLLDTPAIPINSIYGDGQYVTVNLGEAGTADTFYTHNFYPGKKVYLSDLAGYSGADGGPEAINGVYEIYDTPTSHSFRIKSSYRTAMTVYSRNYDEAPDPGMAIIITGTRTSPYAAADHGFYDGEKVVTSGFGSSEFNGEWIIESLPSTVFTSTTPVTVDPDQTFTYLFSSAKTYGLVVANRSNIYAQSRQKVTAGTAYSSVGDCVSYYVGDDETTPFGKILPNQYRAIPDSWTNLYASSSLPNTKVKAVANINTGYQYLNDSNTGPHRGSMYFSTGGDIDTWDPRAVLQIGKSDVTIRGMHVLNDNVIVITTPGGMQDGVHRIKGYLSRLIQYGSPNDPNAVRIELLRGGLGVADGQLATRQMQSALWPDAGVVVFLDHNGGIWYTNGTEVSRIDFIGPATPTSSATNARDTVAAVGKTLFVYRDGTADSTQRHLYCLTMIDATGKSAWTEVSLPYTYNETEDPMLDSYIRLKSMAGGKEYLYLVTDGPMVAEDDSVNYPTRVIRYGLESAYNGQYNEQPLPLTICTPTIGDTSSHRNAIWHRFGITFKIIETAGIGSAQVGTIRIQSIGALDNGHVNEEYVYDPNVNEFLDASVYEIALNREFLEPYEITDIVVPAGIGAQNMGSATITCKGNFIIRSASFWVSGAAFADDENLSSPLEP